MKFKSDIEVQAGIKDKDGQIGSSGQILASTGSQVDWIDQSDIISASSKLVVIACKNTSGATITKGTPVYQTGTVGATDVIEIAKADASDENKMAAIGLLQTDLINNAFGNVVITGELLNLITSPIDGTTPTTGDTIYVKPGGGLTLTKPTGVNFIQNVGLIGKVSTGNSGSITVSSIMRSNDVPTPLYIDHANQRLGIGITSPSEKLEVDGNIKSKRITLSHSGYTGYINQEGDFGGGPLYIRNMGQNHDINFQGNKGGTTSTSLHIDGLTHNIGIGTTSPSEKLDVNGNISVADEGEIYIKGGTSTRKIVRLDNTSDKGLIELSRTDVTKVSISSDFSTHGHTYFDGLNVNVGIGTTSPSAKLDVAGSFSLLGATGGYWLKGFQGASIVNGNSPFLALVNNNNISNANYGWLFYDSNVNGSFNLYRRNNNTTGNQVLTIDRSNGNVGIGTTSPSEKLHVGGNVLSSGNFIAGSPSSTRIVSGQTLISGYYAADTSPRFAIGRDVFGGGKAGIALGGNGGFSYIGTDSTNGDKLIFSTNGSNTLGQGATYERMRIDGSGNVGIGTTSPSGELHVKGANPEFILEDTTNPNKNKIQNTDGNMKYHADYEGTQGNSRHTFFIDGSEKVRFNTNGNVGIGTTSPSSILDINGGSADGVSIQAANVGTEYVLHAKTSNGTSRFWIGGDGNVGIGTNNPSNRLEVVGSYATVPLKVLRHGDYGNVINIGRNGVSETANIGYPADSTINLSTAGSEAMRITSSGNVGIGTTSPAYPLHVNNGTGDVSALFESTDATNTISIKDGSSTSINTTGIGVSGDDLFLFAGNIAYSQRIRIKGSNGNVGIGTTSPSEKLEVDGDIKINRTDSTSGVLTIDTNRSFGRDFTITNNGQEPHIDATDILKITADGGDAGIRIDASGQDYISFTTENSERVRIDPSGNVGIGTTSPQSKLHVLGTTTLPSPGADGGAAVFGNTSSTDYGLVLGTETSGKSYIQSQRNDGTATTYTLLVQPNGGNVGIGTTSPTQKLHVDGNTLISAQRYYYVAGSGAGFGSDASGNFKIRQNGADLIFGSGNNVGIGRTNPSYKLDVNGGARSGGVITYSKSASSLDTTGYAVAGLTSSSNGSSAGFTFTCFGHTGDYQKIVYSCYNDLGTWKTKKVIDEGTNDFDIAASADGSTITFTFKSTSGTKNYTPRVTVEAVGSAINSTYA